MMWVFIDDFGAWKLQILVLEKSLNSVLNEYAMDPGNVT